MLVLVLVLLLLKRVNRVCIADRLTKLILASLERLLLNWWLIKDYPRCLFLIAEELILRELNNGFTCVLVVARVGGVPKKLCRVLERRRRHIATYGQVDALCSAPLFGPSHMFAGAQVCLVIIVGVLKLVLLIGW